jgi:hypothetical protein
MVDVECGGFVAGGHLEVNDLRQQILQPALGF